MSKDSTKVSFSYSIAPLKNLNHAFSGTLGSLNENIVNNLYGEKIGKKIYIALFELVNNVMENTTDKESEVKLGVKIGEKHATVEVSNDIGEDKYLALKQHVDKISSVKDAHALMRETITQNKNKDQRGGLGLIRLVSENKAQLSLAYNKAKSNLTVKSKITL